MDEKTAIELSASPERIIEAIQCNEVIGFLNGLITHLALEEWEAELAANLHHQTLLKQEGKTVALMESEWKVSEQYKNWRLIRLELQKYRAYRNSLRRKEETLQAKPKRYGDYERAI